MGDYNRETKSIYCNYFFIIGGVGGCFVYSGFASTLKTGKQENISKSSGDIKENTKILEDDIRDDAKLNQQKSQARIDYPLIDIYFMDDKEYNIVLTEYMQKRIYKKYSNDGKFFSAK